MINSAISAEAELSGTVELETAGGLLNTKNNKLELLFTPELKLTLPMDSELTAIGRVRSDGYGELTPSSRSDIRLRELYLSTEVGDGFITIGKQQIVWGKADGIKVLDVVNPQEFREFILDGFEASRIPLWSVNVEMPLAGLDMQLIWLPDQTYHSFAEHGATFALTSPLLLPSVPAGVQVNQLPVEKPNRFLADSDVGMRLSTFWKGWDLSLNYLYHFDDTPVLFRQLGMGAAGAVANISPRYQRSHLIGGTFGSAFGNLTLRGEAGYSLGKRLSTNSLVDADGVVQTDEFSYVLGFDWFGFSDALISLQLFQTWVPKYETGVIRDRLDSSASLLIRHNFKNDTIVGETLWIHNGNRGDGLIRPKIEYVWSDAITVWLGADLFYGNRKGLYGQFDKQDRIVAGIEIGL